MSSKDGSRSSLIESEQEDSFMSYRCLKESGHKCEVERSSRVNVHTKKVKKHAHQKQQNLTKKQNHRIVRSNSIQKHGNKKTRPEKRESKMSRLALSGGPLSKEPNQFHVFITKHDIKNERDDKMDYEEVDMSESYIQSFEPEECPMPTFNVSIQGRYSSQGSEEIEFELKGLDLNEDESSDVPMETQKDLMINNLKRFSLVQRGKEVSESDKVSQARKMTFDDSSSNGNETNKKGQVSERKIE